jgi:esterase/lipase superfamily enzyme
MTDDFVISVRNVKAGEFGTEPGVTRFLFVPPGEDPAPAQAIPKKQWVEAVTAAASGSQDDMSAGDILVFVHGYNSSPADMIARHRQILSNLKAQGYQGALVSFDWPSDDVAFKYLEDRSDAKVSALRLVDDCISPLAACQLQDCRINLHVMAHSMGAYVVREAFSDADDRRRLAEVNWTVSQMMLVAGDISSSSLSEGNPLSASLFRHCIRLTNYWYPYDVPLKLSNAKRVNLGPRTGRVGLPANAPLKAVDVDCGAYYHQLTAGEAPGSRAIHSHSWYFGDPVFCQDVVLTMAGDLGRDRFPTREGSNNRFVLIQP